jgi:hypothetical protein
MAAEARGGANVGAGAGPQAGPANRARARLEPSSARAPARRARPRAALFNPAKAQGARNITAPPHM